MASISSPHPGMPVSGAVTDAGRPDAAGACDLRVTRASNSPTGRSPPLRVASPGRSSNPRADWPRSQRGGVGVPRRHVRPSRSQPSNGPGLGAALREPPANRRSWSRSGRRSLSQGRCQPRRLQVRDRPERAGPSLSCAGSRSRRYSSRSPSPRAMTRRSLRSAKNRRRGAGWSRTHSVYMNCPTHQHAPNATLPATSVHHTTAKTSHRAFPSCCHAGPYGFPYLTSPTSSRRRRTPGGSRSPVGSGRRQPTPKYIGGKG